MHSAWNDPFGPGCPIRRSSDHGLVTGSPTLFAGSYVLHRLSTPRHPPCALGRLITSTARRLTRRTGGTHSTPETGRLTRPRPATRSLQENRVLGLWLLLCDFQRGARPPSGDRAARRDPAGRRVYPTGRSRQGVSRLFHYLCTCRRATRHPSSQTRRPAEATTRRPAQRRYLVLTPAD